MQLAIFLLVCIQVYWVQGDDCPTELCSSDETCCPGPMKGLYGCCPAPNAVCCSDGTHCCPENTVCNLGKGTCDDRTNELIPFIFRKKPQKPEIKFSSISIKEAEEINVVYCPDGASYCSDGNTCCILNTGQYGCCPYPSAMCCSDRIHCCPYGSRCDTSSQYCLQANTKLPVAPKRPKKPAFLL